GDRLHQGALPRPVTPDDADRLTVVGGEAHTFQRVNEGALPPLELVGEHITQAVVAVGIDAVLHVGVLDHDRHTGRLCGVIRYRFAVTYRHRRFGLCICHLYNGTAGCGQDAAPTAAGCPCSAPAVQR